MMKKLFAILVVVFLSSMVVPVAQAQGPYQPTYGWAQQAVNNFNYGASSVAGNSYVAGQWAYNHAYSYGNQVYRGATSLWNSNGGPLANGVWGAASQAW